MRLFLLSAMVLTPTFFAFRGSPTVRIPSNLEKNFAFRLSASSSSQEEKETVVWCSRNDCWRPDVSDVERISWGKPAKKKGTGSRGVPHRLNQDERFSYDQARKKGFLDVAGSAWRSERRGAPLLNTFRSLCDARGRAAVVLHKGNSVDKDEVAVDLSPLRLPSTFDRISSFLHNDKRFLPYAEYYVEEEEENVDEINDDDENMMMEEASISSGDVVGMEKRTVTEEEDVWETRPIYQLSPYYVLWKNLPRPYAKTLSKELSILFDCKDPKASSSLKPKGVKPGKSRRSGGYGIG